MKHIKILSIGFMIAIFAAVVPSCTTSKNIVFEEFTSVDAGGWDWKERKKFKFTVTDDQYYYTLNCGLRITGDYAYSNIWMIYTIKGPNKFQQKNQFQLVLSDNLGKWTGKGVSNLVSFQEPFIKNLKLAKGEYTIEFNQNMRDEKLKNVNNIGLQVVRGQVIL